MKKRYIKAAAIVGSVLTLGAACGKKKSNSNTSSPSVALTPSEDTDVTVATGQLQLASTVTILPAKGESAGLALNGESGYKLTLEGRTLNLRVSNEAFNTIEQAGSIMCYFGQSKFWEQANAGVYKALVDEAQCDHKSGGDKGGGGSSGSDKAQSLMVMYTKSTRVEGKPLIGEFRIPEGDDTIHAKVVVVAPPSAENPAGIFSMAYTFYSAAGVASQYGSISTRRTETGAFVLEIAGNEGGEGRSGINQGIAELTADEETGDFNGFVSSNSTHAEGSNTSAETYKVRFNSDFLNVAGGRNSNWGGQAQTEVADGCYDRNKFKTGIYRYDLTDAAGTTVPLNSGFPAEFDKDGKTYSANASYYGLWSNGIDLATGATVYKVDWANGGAKTRTPYTLFKAAGKLIKLTKSTTTLGALKGVDLQMYDSGSNYIVKWDGTKLSKASKVTYTEKGMEESAASGDVTIPEWGLNLNVSSLNANVTISKSLTLSDSTVLSYHSEIAVSGTSDVPAGQLVCFSNCPEMTPAASAFQRSQGSMNGPMVSGLYKSASITWGSNTFSVNQVQTIATAMATYTFDAATLLLNEGSTPFALPAGLPTSEDETRQLDSVFSGALIPIATWQAIADKTIDPYRAQQDLDVYYKWTAGATSWSQFQSLKDAQGTFVSFDRPIEISYTLATADEYDGQTDTNVVGKTYRLSYGGPSQLWGIPWKYNASVGHEMPLFSLKPGTKAGAYLIYPIEGNQRMATTDAANCTSLSLTDLPELPALEDKSVDVGVFGDNDSPTLYIGGTATN